MTLYSWHLQLQCRDSGDRTSGQEHLSPVMNATLSAHAQIRLRRVLATVCHLQVGEVADASTFESMKANAEKQNMYWRS